MRARIISQVELTNNTPQNTTDFKMGCLGSARAQELLSHAGVAHVERQEQLPGQHVSLARQRRARMDSA